MQSQRQSEIFEGFPATQFPAERKTSNLLTNPGDPDDSDSPGFNVHVSTSSTLQSSTENSFAQQ